MFYDSLYIRQRLEWSHSSLDLVHTLIHRCLPHFLSPFKDPSVTPTRVALSETTNTLQRTRDGDFVGLLVCSPYLPLLGSSQLNA